VFLFDQELATLIRSRINRYT